MLDTTHAATSARPVQATITGSTPAAVPEPPSAAGTAGTALLALVLVIGLILVLAKLLKKLPGVGAAGGRAGLQVVATLPLGPKDRVMVVEVGGDQLLLGVGEGGPRLLHKLASPLVIEQAPQSPFAKALAKQIGRL